MYQQTLELFNRPTTICISSKVEDTRKAGNPEQGTDQSWQEVSLDVLREKYAKGDEQQLAAPDMVRAIHERVAAALAMSPRTLQRRLREEGTSYADLLDRFRHRMAVALLEDREIAIYEVAYLLGYAEPSTFYRAFRRWTGSSPREHRAGGD